jgi:hypothetical protein
VVIGFLVAFTQKLTICTIVKYTTLELSPLLKIALYQLSMLYYPESEGEARKTNFGIRVTYLIISIIIRFVIFIS